jgi:hypothetical protein
VFPLLALGAMEAVCDALDALAEEYLELHRVMGEQLTAMESAQRAGYYQMAKARITMGVSE